MQRPLDPVQRLFVAAALGLAGAATALAVFAGDAAIWRDPEWDDVQLLAGFTAAGGAGALAAGLFTAPLFGRADARGVWWLILGAVLSTVLGGAIGGTLVAPGMGSLLGPLVVAYGILTNPIAGLVWIAAMYLVQRRALRWRGAPAAR